MLTAVFRLYRGGDFRDSRAYIELDAEGEGELLLRVDDDHYDCEMSRAQALELAQAIFDLWGPKT